MSDPSPHFLSEYSAKIKEVYVELRDFQFFHSPFSDTLTDARFIGRNAVKQRIKNILERSKTRSGTYLVTGFRGMGKTSVVRQAIDLYNKQSKPKVWQEIMYFLGPLIVLTLLTVFFFIAIISIYNSLVFSYKLALAIFTFLLIACLNSYIREINNFNFLKVYEKIGGFIVLLLLFFFSYFIFYTEFSIPFFESDTINNYLSTLNKIKSNIIKILLVIIHTYIFTSGLFFFLRHSTKFIL
ncbi:MAG: ATP-binding protein [Chitinophagales bacterium]|nr:ATP-binding protein [Chitinophagales bacterium]